jgi:hypothetical protein
MSFPQEIRAEGAVFWPQEIRAEGALSLAQWPQEIDAVYVILHPIKEKDRHDRLIPHLIQRGIPREKIKIVAAYWGDELTSDIIFKVYDPFLKRPCATFTFKGRSLTRGEISLGLNFYFAMRAAIDDGTQRVITLESDVFLREDFVGRLRDLLTDLKGREWDYVSLGEGVGTRPAAADQSMYAGTKAYQPPHQLVYRCTDSMMFQTEYLKKVASTFLPFREIIDWEMNFQNLVHQGKSLWADPPLVEQGTCYGRILTSLPA